MPEETSWHYVYERPDLIEELLTNNQGLFDLESRTKRLIELVEFGARVDYFPTDSETDQRTIQFNYSARAKNALADLVANEKDSLEIYFSYLTEHWNKETTIEVEALLSILMLLDLDKYSREIVACLFALFKTMANEECPFYSVIVLLVHMHHAEKVRQLIEQCLLELLNNRDYNEWTLEALSKLKNPTTPLVEKVLQLSDPDCYDEIKELADIPEQRKRISISIRLSAGIEEEYYPDEILLDVIREHNFKKQLLSRHLLEAWNIESS